ncbi:hypothetical protein SAMN05660489_06071 [Pseudomonas sp. LAMO17WK12:I10]|nr:hypothetical protein H160_06094 [Pseudomonas sp. LAMO17WK12:I9]SNY52906.1 hypothetical protein SAMN05660489_06071 [Pseudomonas sp. LAMO17WK12:I10]
MCSIMKGVVRKSLADFLKCYLIRTIIKITLYCLRSFVDDLMIKVVW